MANLLIEHEGVKGKGLKSIGKQGRAILTIDNNCSIYVDAFQGYGNTYQEREETVLAFEKDGQTIKFNSFNELWEKINTKNLVVTNKVLIFVISK